MIRRETDLQWAWEMGGLIFKKPTGRWYATNGRNTWSNAISQAEATDPERPTRLAMTTSVASRRVRQHWAFDGGVYSIDRWDLADREAEALIRQLRDKERAKVARAMAGIEQREDTGPLARRKPIPDPVKVLVWQRDGGRCVRCGSNERLEYDHIIPVSMGGADTARNLQLLCEACNRAKGGSLV